jgi:hypothetical protein
MNTNRYYLTREELYDLVWSEPMSQLAKKFGLSDVGLAKICRSVLIPVPERGYWAKRQAGKQTTIRPLPPRGLGMSGHLSLDFPESLASNASQDDQDIAPPPVFPDDIAEITAAVRKMVGKVMVPKTLHSPHKAIAKYLQDDERRREKQRSSPPGWPFWDGPIFDTPFERRRLRILNAIFLALARCGMGSSVRGREARETSARVGDASVSFSLDRTTKPRRSGEVSPDERTPSDAKLRLQIASAYGASRPERCWEDKDNVTIEDQLSGIVVALIVAGEEQYRDAARHRYQWRLQEKARCEEEARQRKEEAERRERERQIKLEQERIQRLLGEASAFRQAADIRAFVESVRTANTSAIDPLPQDKVEAWAIWAMNEADRIDPVRSGRILSGLLSEVSIVPPRSTS